MKPLTAKGTRDFSATEIARRDYMKNVLRKAFESFGFEPIETPSFERLETLSGKYGEEGDRLIFKILNSGEKVKKADMEAFKAENYTQFSHSLSEKALRYDLTVPFARYVAQHQNDLVFPFRRYQIQPVWRADRPQHGRFQEFYQCDADIVGDRSLWQEVEMLLLYDAAFTAFGLQEVPVKINHRKVLAGIATMIGAEAQLTDFTVALDKLDKIGQEGVAKELKEKGGSATAIEKLQPLLNLEGTVAQKLKALRTLFANNPIGNEGLDELDFIFEALEKSTPQSINVDLELTLARGLHYYTGMIVEAAPPSGVAIGSIGGGGRYDHLTEDFGMKNGNGIGISFGFERLYLVLEALGLFPPQLSKTTQVLFANFGEEAVEIAFQTLQKLRKEHIPSELYPTPTKLKKQMAYADRKKIPYVLLIGSEEAAQGTFVLKEMASGTQETYTLEALISKLSAK